MSPARPKSKKAKSSRSPRGKAAATPKRAGKPKAAAAKRSTAKGKATPAAAGAKERRHCAATDPFGDPCQSAPRMGSAHCTIHSYLDR